LSVFGIFGIPTHDYFLVILQWHFFKLLLIVISQTVILWTVILWKKIVYNATNPRVEDS